MRRIPVALVALLVTLFLGGCAYYNTFYMARKAWDKAMEERARNPLQGASAAELAQYEQCMRACTNLLTKFPDSKYVDEAVLLIGRCQLGKGDYEGAVTQFQLLCDSLPQSRFVPDALTGQAQALTRLRRFADAESTLNQVLARFPDYAGKDQALITLGDGFRQQKRSREALETYTRLIRECPASEERYRSQTYRGEAYFQLEEWDSARTEFSQVALDAPREEDRFAARLKVGEALERARRFEEAITYYRQQQIDVRAQPKDLQQMRDPDLQLRIAGCEALRGQVDRAVDQYTTIKEAHPNDRFGSVAAYQLGYIQEVNREDFDQARKFYDAVNTMPRSEFTDVAKERNSGLARAAEYKKMMADSKSHFDGRAETAFLLAELYCFDMKKLDRALVEYLGVERAYSFTRFGPKAAFAAGWVLAKMKRPAAADSAYARVAARYSSTAFGLAAQDTLQRHFGAAADSVLAAGGRDTTNIPCPKPPEAIADSIAQAARADSLRRKTVADSIRLIAYSDSLRREALKRAEAMRADSVTRATAASRGISRPMVPAGSSVPSIQAAEMDSVPPVTADTSAVRRGGPPGSAPPPGSTPPDTSAAPKGSPPPGSAPASPAAPPAAPPTVPPPAGAAPGGPAPPDSLPHMPGAPAEPDTGGAAPPGNR
ncbi:MAG: tetratricopeptide repeat protein [Candidatus Eisenbacteria bacterium]|nr:tetratricopeptide repeat protein [Candidatus Eisenbacteria bacterium]